MVNILTADQQTANRLFLAFKDMQDAMRYLEAHEELVQMQLERQKNDSFYFDHCEAILIAAIVAYSRPFKASYAKGFADSKVIAASVEAVAQQQALHDLILMKRDTFIAHADWTARQTEMVRIDRDAVMRKSPMPNVQAGINTADFRELVKRVGYQCRDKAYEIDMGKAKTNIKNTI